MTQAGGQPVWGPASDASTGAPTLPAVGDGSRERIGVFGGTFDPPHLGHLAIALEVGHALSLDRVLLMVAGDPWQKTALRSITPAVDRLDMVEAGIDGVEGVEVSDLEVRRGGPSYMADTLADLAAAAPDADLFMIAQTVGKKIKVPKRVDTTEAEFTKLFYEILERRYGVGPDSETERFIAGLEFAE